ncbi:cytochrome P450 [Aspergillus ruber CBS 135680]|uniref:Cytochrome P450 n=1 Tax=Aspergillus ruber (strain CBS 135680) TaxID=1388766 RepID=A0A017S0S2_ASPRC|nr:cytochrome P450 [Aspergillus ruber CBS 135680]EYE90618.1 cytochrome P450 [Aspergillus ruber CBS 135680]
MAFPIVIYLFITLISWHVWSQITSRRLPPGPIPLPLIGNIHQLWSPAPWKVIQVWHKQYGPIITIRLGPIPIICIGSHDVVRDLYEKRGRIYSSRPRMIFLNECMFEGHFPAAQPDGPYLRILHRLQYAVLNKNATDSYRCVQDLESKQVLHDLLLNPENFKTHFERYASSITYLLLFGKRIVHPDASEKQEVDRFLRLFVGANGLSDSLLDIFPFLNSLPGPFAPWKATGKKVNQEMKRIISTSLEQRRGWNWSEEIMHRQETSNLPPGGLQCLLLELYLASSMTTYIILQFLIKACAVHSEALKQMQTEIDTVVGDQRLPTFDDEKNLPYLKGFINEVLRYYPLVTIGVPRTTTQPDEYMGYRIPKGSIVVANNWGLDRDEELHDRPDEFRPERWIEKPGPRVTVFGFGRRACSGEHLGRASLFIVLARCLWGYDIIPRPNLDNTQQPESGNAVFSVPVVNAEFRLRSPERREIMEREWLVAEKDEGKIMTDLEASVSRRPA